MPIDEKKRSLLKRASQFNDDVSNSIGFDKINKYKHDALDAMDESIQKHVVNPISEAGYPNVGAGIGTAISAPVRTAAEFVPESAASTAMTFFPAAKVTKLFNPAEESFLIKSIKNSHPGISEEAVNSNLLNMEKQYAARQAGKDLANPAMAQQDTRAASQIDALNTKAKPDTITAGKDIPILDANAQTARTSNSVSDELIRRAALTKKTMIGQ